MKHDASQFEPNEEERKALEEHGILRIPMDTPFLSEPVNVYVVLGDPITLIDGGLRYKHNLSRLTQALAQHGLAIEDIGEIYLTHPHIDHFGLAASISYRSGAPITTWKHSQHRFEQYPQFWTADRNAFASLVERAGAPASIIQEVRSAKSQFLDIADPIHIHHTRDTDETFTLAGRFPAQLLHIPGHSPWCTGLWLPQQQLIFSGDSMLKRVRFQILLYPHDQAPPSWQGYGAFRPTLQRLLQLPIQRNLPGHGASFCDAHPFLERTLRQQLRRREQIASWLVDGPKTAYEIALGLFGSDITHNVLLLVMSEVIGHLEWLVAEQQAFVPPDEPIAFYHKQDPEYPGYRDVSSPPSEHPTPSHDNKKATLSCEKVADLIQD